MKSLHPIPARPPQNGGFATAPQNWYFRRSPRPDGAEQEGISPMADTTERADLNLWRELASKDRKGAAPDDLVWHTPEGIDVKPLYTRADVENLTFTDTVPGAFPFLR